MKTEDIIKIIHGDIDFMFNLWDVEKIEWDKTVRKDAEWDYTLKIKLAQPNPFSLKNAVMQTLYIDQYLKDLFKPESDCEYFDTTAYDFMIVGLEQ